MKAKSAFLVKILCTIVYVLVWQVTFAQEKVEHSKEPQLRGAAVMAYSYIPQAFEGDKSLTVIPTWGIDIDYFFNPKWAICLQTDIKVQSFEVEDRDNVVLTRNYPVTFATMAYYRVLEHWSVCIGPGIEYEQSQSLWILKLGAEYSHEFSERFELGVGLMYENRQDLYDGFTFGVSFNTRLWKKKSP